MRTVLSVAAGLALVVMTIRAQGEITGKWRGQTRNGTEIVLDLVAKGTALTGTLARNGESVPISDGKVSKQTLTFKAVLNDQTEGFSGELNGDQDLDGPARSSEHRCTSAGQKQVIAPREASRCPKDS